MQAAHCAECWNMAGLVRVHVARWDGTMLEKMAYRRYGENDLSPITLSLLLIASIKFSDFCEYKFSVY